MKNLEELKKEVIKKIDSTEFKSNKIEVSKTCFINEKKEKTEFKVVIVQPECFTTVLRVRDCSPERCFKRFLFEIEMLTIK